MKRIAIYWITALMANPIFAVGQNNPQPVKGMASTVGLYVYPKNHQSANQQLTDESQCYTDAKSQTGFDPNAAAPATATKAQSEKGGDKSMAQGAARGAVISGATGGDPAAGARRGAIIGGIKSKRKQKQETAQADKQADADKTQQQQLDNFKRSLSSCLDSRNYSVK